MENNWIKCLGENRLVHLDLKRAPLKVDYFEKVFPFIREWGATGLLIEWEDTFPYSGELTCIGSLNTPSKAYSESDIERILDLAEKSNLTVIPLVQTFGHLEFVLRHEEWKELRELWRFTNALCPSNPKSLALVTSMIDQVIARMPKSLRYFHIGADEVWQLGSCGFCSREEKNVIFLEHLAGVLKHFREKHPHVRPIMWDDMLRPVPTRMMEVHGLADMVDIMVWFYEPAPYFNIPEELWDKYTTIFKENIWIASAFKGATGATQILPVIQHHISNHEQWLAHVRNSSTHIKGIALTGWSRYDHFATLCELLPTALPCLAICLSIMREGGYSQEIYKKVSKSLGYLQVPLLINPYPRAYHQGGVHLALMIRSEDGLVSLKALSANKHCEGRPRPQAVASELSFPGWQVATGVEWLGNLKGKHLAIINSDQVGAWMNPWQLMSGFISPMQIQGIISTLFEMGEEWVALEKYMKEQMSTVYYEPQVEEWIATHCKPHKEKALELWKAGSAEVTSQLGSEANKLPKAFFPTPRPI